MFAPRLLLSSHVAPRWHVGQSSNVLILRRDRHPVTYREMPQLSATSRYEPFLLVFNERYCGNKIWPAYRNNPPLTAAPSSLPTSASLPAHFGWPKPDLLAPVRPM